VRIAHNITAMFAYRQYSLRNEAMAKSVQRLSSGLRINCAADDPAGLAISEKMRSQIRGLNMAVKNCEDAVSLIQTAEGALNETHAILQRMRELAMQSASDTNTDGIDRNALNAEFQQLKQEINDIAKQTRFNSMNLLDGGFGVSVDEAASSAIGATGVTAISISGATAGELFTFTDLGTDLTIVRQSDGETLTIAGGSMQAGEQTLYVDEFGITIKTDGSFTAAGLNGLDVHMTSPVSGGVIQTGANAGDTMGISIGNMSAAGIGISSLSVDSRDGAQSALSALDGAIEKVSVQRATLGAQQNRLQHKIENLQTTSENLQAAESRIRDVDMAKEMSEYTKNSIMVQVSTAILAQANAAPKNVLTLLESLRE